MKAIPGKIKQSTNALYGFLESMCTMVALAKQFGLTISEVDKGLNRNNDTESN